MILPADWWEIMHVAPVMGLYKCGASVSVDNSAPGICSEAPAQTLAREAIARWAKRQNVF
jgi:hypothetical protein